MDERLWELLFGRYSLRGDVKRGMDMANEADALMHATTPEGKALYWVPREPWIVGDPSLTAAVEAVLFLASLEGGIMVTPTGPQAPAEVSNQLAVFAAVNKATHHEVEWTNPPDVLGDIPEGAADGPSAESEAPAGKTEESTTRAPMVRAANEARQELGLGPLKEE